MPTIRFLRGLAANLSAITPQIGEPVWVTDTKEFRVGDGVTQGGVPLNFTQAIGGPTLNQVALWDASGNLTGQDKSIFLAGYATETFVNNGLATKLGTGDKAADSFQADNALALGGQLPAFYLDTTLRSDSILSTSSLTVATSNAVNQVKVITDGKIDTSAISQDFNSTSTTDVASSGALKAGLDSKQTQIDAKIEADDYAAPTVGGTIKMRVDGDTLHISNDGSNP